MTKNNRSTVRSCEMLRRAYGELTLEKEAEKITVVEVVERAGLSRHTFYSHYDDIFALAEDVKDNFERKFNCYIGAEPFVLECKDPMNILEKFSGFILESEDMCKLLLQTPNFDCFMEKMKHVFVEGVSSGWEKDAIKHTEKAKLLLYLLAGGMSELYTAYLKGKVDCTLQQINEELVGIYNAKMQELQRQ